MSGQVAALGAASKESEGLGQDVEVPRLQHIAAPARRSPSRRRRRDGRGTPVGSTRSVGFAVPGPDRSPVARRRRVQEPSDGVEPEARSDEEVVVVRSWSSRDHRHGRSTLSPMARTLVRGRRPALELGVLALELRPGQDARSPVVGSPTARSTRSPVVGRRGGPSVGFGPAGSDAMRAPREDRTSRPCEGSGRTSPPWACGPQRSDDSYRRVRQRSGVP